MSHRCQRPQVLSQRHHLADHGSDHGERGQRGDPAGARKVVNPDLDDLEARALGADHQLGGDEGTSFIDAELMIRANRSGFEIVQIGVDYFPRTRGVSTLSSFAVIRTMVREMMALRKDLRSLTAVAHT